MSKIDYQALREAAVAIETVATPQKLLAFRMKVTPQVVLALLDERDALNERLAELEADLAGLTEDHQKATESIKQADSAVKLAHEKFSALAAENAGLKDVESNLVRNIINDLGDTEFQYEKVQTPATDAFLAEVRAQERTDFIGRIEWIIRNECNPDKTETILNELQSFSDQLRKGGNQ
ncbi:hypothetical protein BMR29_17785 [Escherichia coli]|uniref:ead/Ea22-like family protein n=1 Tax=Escherichia coli TaxID=562 RepID=UPI000BF9BA22|nr:ead/Ea22-like family protein [Escherichia coli]PGG11430.1 hypothetical protein BMR29_17785 [Escherichia coli]